MNKKDDVMYTDSILGELGSLTDRFQLMTYISILLPLMCTGFFINQPMFNAARVNYRCFVPECEVSPTEYNATLDWAAWAYPDSGGQCERFRPIDSGCSPSSFHVNETIKCNAWVYENNNSIVATFDLACADWKRTLVGTIHNVGLFCALPLTGYVSDRFGRRAAFIFTAVAAGVMGVIRSFSTSYVMYLVFEYLEALVGSGVYSTGFILALEMVSLKQRVLGGNMISSTFAIGQVILALLAWAFPYWRTLTRVIYAPSFIFILYYFVIEESVRWLLSRGRKEEAAKIIFKAAAMNKKELSPEAIKHLSAETKPPTEDTNKIKGNGKLEEKKISVVSQVIRSRILVSRLFICSFWWITVTFIYYGLSINSVSLAGNPYVNYMLTSLVEIPGYCLSVLTLDRFGRKSSIMTAFFVCGISLLSLPFVPNTLQWLSTCLTMLGKLCISMVFSSIYIYTSELYPTILRQRLLSICSMVGRIGSIVAPQTPLLMRIMTSLPYLVFGVMAGISGALTLLTPETLHMRLPDTVKQAEDLAVAPRTRKRRTDIIVD